MLSLSIRLVMILLGFVQAVLIARLLGSEGYGMFAVTLSAASVAAGFGTLGFGGYAVREVSRLRVRSEPGMLKGFVTVSVMVVLLASVVGGAVVSGFTLLPSLEAPVELVWSLLITPMMALLLLARGLSQGFGRVLATQAPTELIRPAFMVLGLVAVWIIAKPTTPGTMLGLLAAANLAALLLAAVLIFRAVDPSVTVAAHRSNLAGWFRGAWPFFGLGLLFVLHAEINTLMLGWLAGPKEAGLFQPLMRIAPIMLIARHAINVPLAPRISELWEKGDTDKLRHTVWVATLTTTVLVFASCMVILVSAPWILSAFGAEFVINGPALWWLAAAQLFNASCGSVGILLNMTGHQGETFKGLLAAVAINFTLGLWLIPAYGALGAAITFAASICVWYVLMLRAVRNRLGFDSSIVAGVAYLLRKG